MSKNCGKCLGYHPAPFGKSCQHSKASEQGIMASKGEEGKQLLSPEKSPLPSREEHLRKLVAKEEETNSRLEEKHRVVQLEHQLATLRVSNKDIVRDIEENDMVAASLGVH